jgi:hypothetical protein
MYSSDILYENLVEASLVLENQQLQNMNGVSFGQITPTKGCKRRFQSLLLWLKEEKCFSLHLN